MTARIHCASIFRKTKYRRATGVRRVMKIAIHLSTEPSGWTRRRSVNSLEKCWSNGGNNFGFAILDFGLEQLYEYTISDSMAGFYFRQSKIENPKSKIAGDCCSRCYPRNS